MDILDLIKNNGNNIIIDGNNLSIIEFKQAMKLDKDGKPTSDPLLDNKKNPIYEFKVQVKFVIIME